MIYETLGWSDEYGMDVRVVEWLPTFKKVRRGRRKSILSRKYYAVDTSSFKVIFVCQKVLSIEIPVYTCKSVICE